MRSERDAGVVTARLAAVLSRVEALGSPATGALLVGDRQRPDGVLFLEGERICWIAASGMGRRLRDILRQRSARPLAEADLDAIYARCRADETPLGEALVAEGWVTAADMRAAMKQHTAESLLALDALHGAGWPLTWVERRARGYHPRFTFTATEVLAAVGAVLGDPTQVELAEEQLACVARSGCTALAFDPPAPTHVLGAVTTVGLLVDEVIELGGWALAALGASVGFSPLVVHATARAADAGGTAAWRYEGCVLAAVCPSAESLVRLVACVDNQGLPMVLSTSSAVSRRVRARVAVTVSQRHA